MDFKSLKSELSDDPNGVGYGGMTTQQKVDNLNTLVPRDRASMSREEVIELIDSGELSALTGDDLVRVFGVLGDTINPFGIAQAVFVSAFGASATITALAAARVENISRATELGFPEISIQMIEVAEGGSW